MRLHTVGRVILLALAMLLTAEAQQAAKVARVGCLIGGPLTSERLYSGLEAFRQGLRELGWVEGQNLAIEIRVGEDKYEQYVSLAAELVGLKVDVILASAAPAIRAAQHTTATIPIVFATLADPEVLGVVASLAQPGGNLTGLAGLPVELSSKRLELLKEALPSATRVAVLANPANPMMATLWRETERAAHALGMQLHLLEVRAPHEVESALATLTSARADAVLTLQDPTLNRQRRQIVELAAQHRLPVIGAEVPEWAEAGGLMAYGPSGLDLYRRAAIYVDKILKGTTIGMTRRRRRFSPNAARAMPAHSRLLLMERVIPPGNTPSVGKLADITMLVHYGALERTEAEYRTLLEASGFTLVRIIPTQAPLSIIEGIPA